MTERSPSLRRGWTTGACATAAATAALGALRTGVFPDPVTIFLPGGAMAAFALAGHGIGDGAAWAAIVKDAGDDPDVTHGALIRADLRAHADAGRGLVFRAGPGVGTVTRPGLPIPPGEPAINPVPRAMVADNLERLAGTIPDLDITLSIEGGEALAAKTLNGRLGIVGGLSILGTTGIVVPYSCAAWIDTIRRGIDVARAMGLDHIAASTGDVSERAVQRHYGLPEPALIEMGDFAGGVLKYVRDHPVPRLTIAGGIAKMTKLAQGRLDLHSRRGAADLGALARLAARYGAGAEEAARMAACQTVSEAFLIADHAGIALGDAIARAALAVAREAVGEAGVAIDVMLFDRAGICVGRG